MGGQQYFFIDRFAWQGYNEEKIYEKGGYAMTDMRCPLLAAGQTLHLQRPDGDAAGQWQITAVVGRGGSAVCYNAQRGSKTGRLKEFLPYDHCAFRREADGRLTAVSPKAEMLCGEFLRAYETLEQYKRSSTDAQLLNNFLPAYEVLRGGDSVYIWTPDDKQGVSFEQYLRQAWKAPHKSPEHKLYNILRTVLTLTDCIRVFHRVGLLHLDIKPDNFLVLYDGQFNISPANISVFDISTLSPADGAFQVLAGTDGYFAPEVPKGKADNRSDIYSIGAMLFRAVTNMTGYRKTLYPQLDRLIADSDLIEASQTNANVFLRHVLGRILKNCLATRPADRYGCCEELMTDLEQAITFLLPDVAEGKLGLHKRLAVLDTEPQADCDPTAVLHDLLFRYPLDRNGPSSGDLRVLVLGAGTYGQKFIDICLQAGQLHQGRLQITALSQQPELDREIYLQIRPALTDFVDCGGMFTGFVPYARLDFKPMTFETESTAAQVQAFLAEYAPHYVFISLGDDHRNRRTAKLVGACGIRENVFFVTTAPGEEKEDWGQPVYIRKTVTPKTIHPQLHQMALRTHMVWMDTPQPDEATARRQLRKKYHYHASLGFALSVPGKLRRLGIAFDDPEAAAREFQNRLCHMIPETLGLLAALEHRRWVLEKVTAGWQPERDLPGSIDRGTMVDATGRTHPCLVHSTAAVPLQTFTRQQWDTPGSWDEDLDPLDLFSVGLHRLCLEAAKQLRASRPLQTGEVALIGRRLEQAPAPVKAAFEEYRLCLQGILQGNYQAAQVQDSKENALRKTFSMLSSARRKELLGRLQQVRREFFPAVEACRFRDYKGLDASLIASIPYILDPQLAACKNSHPKLLPEPVVSAARAAYMPAPPDTDSILLPPQLLELTEQLAENIHDIWASGRLSQGWTYGESRDDDAKTHPCLVPYEQLSEEEKGYDRSTAMQTLKIITALGYRIEPPAEE